MGNSGKEGRKKIRHGGGKDEGGRVKRKGGMNEWKEGSMESRKDE